MRLPWPLVFLALPLAAQQPPAPAESLPAPPPGKGIVRGLVLDTSLFAPMAWPQGNDQRHANGAPGSGYWQQRADYTIKVILDTAAKRLSGTVIIRYTNRSPDSLSFVWVQLDQNLFQAGSLGSLLNSTDSRSGGHGFVGGYRIEGVTQSPADAASTSRTSGGKKAPPPAPARLTPRIDDTMMFVPLATPLPPGGSTVLTIDYGFDIPEMGADRMGREGNTYLIAQWYPRMAVYDDVNGWNTLPYTGDGEFYLEFGDFDYEVTLPAGFLMAGTGLVQNPQEVYTPTERSRLGLVAKSDSIVHLVTEADLGPGSSRATRRGTTTWKFRAQNVRDVAFAASPDYLWDATSWNGITTQAVYRASAASLWQHAADMTRASIREYSTRWFPYPYPQATAVEGPVSGMEYPMVAMEAKGESIPDLFVVIAHELGHIWFPMMVGSDERRYGWMDEGFDEFMNRFAESAYLNLDMTELRKQYTADITAIDQLPGAQPIMTGANRFRGVYQLNNLAYFKPMLGLYILREKVLGPAVFDAAFREYIRRWAFKHPQPADFFRTIENISGKDLAWLWRGWFYGTGGVDQAIEGVRQRSNTDGTTTALIALRNQGPVVMPVEMRIILTDGSVKTLSYPAEIWMRGERYNVFLQLPKPLQSVQLNPDGLLPDVVPANNRWGAPQP
jgi:hypothetical protein